MEEVFDFYCQIGTDDWLARNRSVLAYTSSVQDIESAQAGFRERGMTYRGAVILPFPSVANCDYAEANQLIRASAAPGAAVASAAPGAAVAGLLLAPAYAVIPREEASVRWLEQCLESQCPCLGVKLWPYMGGFSLTSLLEDRKLVDLIIKFRLLVLMHVGTGREMKSRPAFADVAADPRTALTVVKALPDVTFVLGHLLRLSSACLEEAAGLGNVYLDTSGLSSIGKWRENGLDSFPANDSDEKLWRKPAPLIIAEVAERYGLGPRMLFGSNWPFCKWWGYGPLEEAAIIRQSPIEDSVKRQILCGNAMTILEQVRRRASA